VSSVAPAPAVKSAPWVLRRPRIGRPRLITVVLILLIALAPPTYLAQTSGAVATGYTIQRLQGERDAWKLKNQQLELEVAKARSLAWVEAEAVNRLGMQRPAQQTVVAVDVMPPKVASEARPPAPARAAGSAELEPSAGADPVARAISWAEGVGAFLAGLVGR